MNNEKIFVFVLDYTEVFLRSQIFPDEYGSLLWNTNSANQTTQWIRVLNKQISYSKLSVSFNVLGLLTDILRSIDEVS